MAFTLDNLTQQATGSFNGNSGSVTLPAGTEAGNAVVIIAGLIGDGVNNADFVTPSGFAAINDFGARPDYAAVQTYIKTSAGAGETSWTLSLAGGASRLVLWAVFELSDADLDWPDKAYLAGAVQSGITTTVTSAVNTATGQSDSYEAVELMVYVASATDATQPDVANYTDLFYEILSVSGNDAARGATLAVAARADTSVGTPSCTADISPTSYVGTVSLVFTGLTSYHASNVHACFGAEIGTTTGLTTSDPGANVPGPWDSSAGSPAIVTTTPRTGNYCLELSSIATAEWVAWNRKAAPAGGTLGSDPTTNLPPVWVERFHFYFPGSLPIADTVIASCEVGSLANGLQIRYVAASQKIGVQIGSGTEVLSDTTVVADQWIGIDYRYDPRTTTHVCDWRIDYDADPDDVTPAVPQTSATTSSMTAGGISLVRKGWTGATITATVRYDDIVAAGPVVAGVRHSYPLGDVRITPLKVDPAGTPTVSGNAANFKVFTSNGGTLSTWDAAGTRAALDDIPPVIGSTADGLAQVAVAATEYVEVPYEPFTCAPDFAPMGGRHYVAWWAASGNPASIRFRPIDGVDDVTAPFTINGSVDQGADDATIVWGTRVHVKILNTVYRLTQAMVDALGIRLGFSEDANPDAGIHAILFELVLVKAVNFGTVEAESGAFHLYTRQHPHSGAVIGWEVATPSGSRGATLSWTIGGTPGSEYVGPNTTHVKPVGAANISDVQGVGLTPDAT